MNAELSEKQARGRPRKQDRTERIPLGTMRTKLAVEPMEGYILRWVNDKDNRINFAEQGGYDFVTYDELGDRTIGQHNTTSDSSEEGEKVSKVVGTTQNGAPLSSFLMKIRKEWYDEDQAKKAGYVDSTEQSLIDLDGADGDFKSKTYGSINISR